MMMGTGKSKFCRVGWQTEKPDRSQGCGSSLTAVSCRTPSCSEEVSQTFNGLEAHSDYGGQSALPTLHDLNVNLIQNPSQKHPE